MINSIFFVTTTRMAETAVARILPIFKYNHVFIFKYKEIEIMVEEEKIQGLWNILPG